MYACVWECVSSACILNFNYTSICVLWHVFLVFYFTFMWCLYFIILRGRELFWIFISNATFSTRSSIELIFVDNFSALIIKLCTISHPYTISPQKKHTHFANLVCLRLVIFFYTPVRFRFGWTRDPETSKRLADPACAHTRIDGRFFCYWV